MYRHSRHRLSLRRLARGVALPWLARALALLLVLGNAFAAVAPLRMLTPAMHGVGAMAAMVDQAAPGYAMQAMHHHHHPAAAVADGYATQPAPHGAGCPCCDTGHCGCLQACNPLPQIAAALTTAPLLFAAAPAPMQVAAATSIVVAPPLRPPIAVNSIGS
jgi:hypothetical protein